jgi:hypothetical protein
VCKRHCHLIQIIIKKSPTCFNRIRITYGNIRDPNSECLRLSSQPLNIVLVLYLLLKSNKIRFFEHTEAGFYRILVVDKLIYSDCIESVRHLLVAFQQTVCIRHILVNYRDDDDDSYSD